MDRRKACWRLTKIDNSRSFQVNGPRGDRRAKPACLNGSVNRKGTRTTRRPITLAAKA